MFKRVSSWEELKAELETVLGRIRAMQSKQYADSYFLLATYA